MSLTVYYDSVNDQTVAYYEHGKNRFVAEGQWSETEVRMALRLARRLPIGSWNRAPQTVQFSILLALARDMQAAETSVEELRDIEIYRATATGEQVVGKRTDKQPEYLSGTNILVLSDGHVSGDTYELVYDRDAETIAWQKQGFISTNTIAVRNGAFDVLDETGALRAYILIDTANLPPESRTEEFVIEEILSLDYLERIADNYTGQRLPRLVAETDTAYRLRILNRIREIRVTLWGLQRRLGQSLNYLPRIEENREHYEDWAVADTMAAASDIESAADPTVSSPSVAVLNPSDDTEIQSRNPFTNYGSATVIGVGVDAWPTWKKRGLFKFDISSIPSDAIIESATLELYHATPSVIRTLNIHGLTADLDEGNATWDSINTAFTSTVEGTIDTTGTSQYHVSTDIKDIVFEWLSGERQNYGLMVKDSLEDTINTIVDYESKEAASNLPILRVTYRTPVAGAVVTDAALITALAGSIDAFFGGNSTRNYFLGIHVKDSDAGSAGVEAQILEAKPASRRTTTEGGYPETVENGDATEAAYPASAPASTNETDRKREIVFSSAADEIADFVVLLPDDYAGEELTFEMLYRATVTEGRALFRLEARKVAEGGAWDAALAILREFKVRAPDSTSDVWVEWASLGTPAGWSASDAIQLRLTRVKTDAVDDLGGDVNVQNWRIMKR